MQGKTMSIESSKNTTSALPVKPCVWFVGGKVGPEKVNFLIGGIGRESDLGESNRPECHEGGLTSVLLSGLHAMRKVMGRG